MSNKSDEIKSTFKPTFDKNWQEKFNELCYLVFYKDGHGKELLSHLENKFFRSPVAYPNREPSWAFFNEGQNEMIRSFSAGIMGYVAQNAEKREQETVNKPII